MVLTCLYAMLGTSSPMLARRAVLDRYLFCFTAVGLSGSDET
jgi:hypothetical protein